LGKNGFFEAAISIPLSAVTVFAVRSAFKHQQMCRTTHWNIMKLFTNASLPTSSTALKRVNVLFDQKILKISPEPIESEEISQVIDLKGMILLPGGVDAHSHIIREKDPTKSIARVSKAAILGGWTSFAELSYLDPKPITSTEALQAKRKVIEGISHVDMALWGNVDIDDYPYHAEAAQELWGVGAAGIALMNPSPNPQLSALDFTEIMDLFWISTEVTPPLPFRALMWMPEQISALNPKVMPSKSFCAGCRKTPSTFPGFRPLPRWNLSTAFPSVPISLFRSASQT